MCLHAISNSMDQASSMLVSILKIPDIAQRGETGSVRALMRSGDVQNRLLSINPMSMTIPYALTAAF